VRLFRQPDAHSCGAAAMLMVLRHYGIQEKFNILCEKLKVYGILFNGVTPFKMLQVLKDYGFYTKLLTNSDKCSDVNLVLLRSPLHWVVWYYNGRSWKEYDPNRAQSSELSSNRFVSAIALQ